MKKIIVTLSMLCFALSVVAQDRFANVEVEATKLPGSIYMLTGAGGNIGISVGEDGVLMIDDQYDALGGKIADAIKSVTDSKTRFIVNTHYHGDHTGSNAFFAKNHGVTIFAHENVRIRLASAEDADPKSLPVVTYQDGIKFHMNGETVDVFHLSDAHTDGDSAVYFESADVLHAGDLFFNKMFPYIDIGAGGNVLGYIDAIEIMLNRISDETTIIPGHGPLATKTDLENVVKMIKETYAYVQTKKSQGMSEQAIIDEGLDPKWDEWSWRFITTERWIKTLYQ